MKPLRLVIALHFPAFRRKYHRDREQSFLNESRYGTSASGRSPPTFSTKISMMKSASTVWFASPAYEAFSISFSSNNFAIPYEDRCTLLRNWRPAKAKSCKSCKQNGVEASICSQRRLISTHATPLEKRMCNQSKTHAEGGNIVLVKGHASKDVSVQFQP